jgi:fucose permease
MQARIVRGSLVLMLCASTILFTATGSVSALLGSAFLLGFGIGPVYPLMLACALRFYRGGAIFFLAGVGSASLPWAMGLVSTRWHSLHAGFAIPLAGSALMLVTSLTTQLHSGADRELQP